MRKWIAGLVALCVLLSGAACARGAAPEGQENSEQLIFLPEDAPERPGLQISGVNESGESVSMLIIGVESEPVACGYGAFFDNFSAITKSMFAADIEFSDCVYSDSAWARVAPLGAVCVVVRSAGSGVEDSIIEVVVSGSEAQLVFLLTVACMMSAADVGQMGTAAMYALMYDQEMERYFEKPIDVWLENGFQLSFETDQLGVLYGKVAYTQPLPVLGVYQPLESEALTPLATQLTLGEFVERLTPLCGMFGLTKPKIPDEYDTYEGLRNYSVYWDDCALIISVADVDATMQNISLASISGDTVNLWMRAMLIYSAIVDATIYDFEWLASLAGAGGDWQRLSEMSPYVIYNGAMLTCMVSEDMPCAIISGAIITGEVTAQ